jgi:hypothetical protein
MPRDINKAPRWQPDAIPTIKGWVHPKTGELLIATKNINLSLFEEKQEKVEEEPKKKTTKKTTRKKRTSKKNAKK